MTATSSNVSASAATLDADQLLRLADALTAAAAANARLAKVISDLARADKPVRSGQVSTCRLSRHRQTEIARSWHLSRLANWPAGTPAPSAAQDLRDARNDLGMAGVSRDVLRAQRPVEWQLDPDQRPTSPKT